MANNSTFTGWSGKTNSISGSTFDISMLNLSGRTQSSPQASSKITTGPISIINQADRVSNRPKHSENNNNQRQLSTITRLTVPQEVTLNVPFTAGTVDYSFPNGDSYGFSSSIYDILVQPDGKILVAGDTYSTYYFSGNSYDMQGLIRLNSDGTVDDTFSIIQNNDCYGGGFQDTVLTIALQPDGKILAGGYFNQFDRDGNCYQYNRIIRLNSDGSRDLTFNIGGGFNNDVNKLVVQPDGKILVGGSFNDYNGNSVDNIIRLNSNGSIDSSFDISNRLDSTVYDIVLQSDGKILVGGDFTNFGGNSQNYIIRLNSNGTKDTSFNIGNGFNGSVYAIALQSDSKIIVGGSFNYFDNNDLFNGYIVRLDSNGSLDTYFGYGLDNDVNKITIQSDDKILVGGYFGTYYIDNNNTLSIDEIVRFHSDCTFDYSFYYDELMNNGVYAINVLSDGNILVGGEFDTNGDPTTYPLNYFGRLHNSISVYPYTYTVQACTQPLNGETITYVVGSMTPLNGEMTYSFQSLQNPSVTVCGYITDIYPSNIIEYTSVNVYNTCQEAYKSNYKMVQFQECHDYYNNPPYWVVDNRFEIGDIFYNDTVVDLMGRTFFKFAATIVDVVDWSQGYWENPWDYLPPVNYMTYSSCNEAIEDNGLIYVALSCIEQEVQFPLIHSSYNDTVTLLSPTGDNPVKFLVDYLPYGNYDIISGGTPEIFSTIKIADGEDCIAGLTKIAPEGVLNYDFYNGGFNGGQNGPFVYTMVEQPDGKLLVGGNFNQYNGTYVGNFMRLNSDGTIDDTFYLGQFDSYVRAIALQPDGKILVGGNFQYYNEELAGRIIRLNSDGTIDQDFTYNSEFNGIVRAIAVQRDGKIVVGGGFDYYYDFYCPQIVRLNSDGTPDPTFVMGNGFDGDNVFTINIETIRNNPFYNDNGPVTYTENIIVGGWFTWYNGTNVRGIVKLSSTGEILPDFGIGFNDDNGGSPRVNQILMQPDGKVVIIGGADGGYLYDYKGTWIPQNIVRLEKDSDGIYQIDNTFTTRDWDNSGGFNSAVLSISLLPNGKYMVGGQFDSYGDNNDNTNVPYLVRLNSDGTLDKTFTFVLNDDYVNKVLLLSSGRLFVGGRFYTPSDRLLELCIGEEYVLRPFTTCDGVTGNIFLPTEFPISTTTTGGGNEFTATTITYEPISTSGLNIVYDGDYDDNNFFIELPVDFDVNFLGTNYTSIYVGSNSYLTFGGGSSSNGIDPLPGDIPSETGLPGVYLSTRTGQDKCLDSAMWLLYTGTTDGGNTLIVRFEGNDDYDSSQGDTNLVYNFKFYKDQSNYFDLIIEQNQYYCNDDPTGGVSNGVDGTWVVSFDTSGENAYRIGLLGETTVNPIKANVNDRAAVCGSMGDIITSPIINSGNPGVPGSIYFDGNDNNLLTVSYNVAMDLDFDSWTVEWFQYYTSTDTCCRRVFDIGSFPNEHFGVSLENGNIVVWLERPSGPQFSFTLPDPIYNTWSHFAITSEDIGFPNRRLRVFQNGVVLGSFQIITVDMNNFDGPTLLPLTIGGMSDGTGTFQGYITNFRWNKGTCYYTNDFPVPTSPLSVDGSQLLLLAQDPNNFVYDSSESQSIIEVGLTWSEMNPFANQNDFTLFTSTNSTSYSGCTECGQTYQTKLLVRDGVNPEKVETYRMTLNSINNVLTNGPIFTTRGPECYEILKYTY